VEYWLGSEFSIGLASFYGTIDHMPSRTLVPLPVAVRLAPVLVRLAVEES